MSDYNGQFDDPRLNVIDPDSATHPDSVGEQLSSKSKYCSVDEIKTFLKLFTLQEGDADSKVITDAKTAETFITAYLFISERFKGGIESYFEKRPLALNEARRWRMEKLSQFIHGDWPKLCTELRINDAFNGDKTLKLKFNDAMLKLKKVDDGYKITLPRSLIVQLTKPVEGNIPELRIELINVVERLVTIYGRNPFEG